MLSPLIPSDGVSSTLKLRANVMAVKVANEACARGEKFHFVNENIFVRQKLIIIFLLE